jgi:hypothetical protein
MAQRAGPAGVSAQVRNGLIIVISKRMGWRTREDKVDKYYVIEMLI